MNSTVFVREREGKNVFGGQRRCSDGRGKEVELEGSPPVQGGFDGSVDSMVAKYTEERRVGDSAKLFLLATTHGLMGSNIKETTVGGSRTRGVSRQTL